VFEALSGASLQAVLIANEEALTGLNNKIPGNFIVRSYVPQLALLPHMNAVLCHGGHNTVVETLMHGLPLLVAPIRDDQFVVASQVENAGAGIKMNFRRARAPKISSAVDRIFTEPSFRTAAQRIRASLMNAGGGQRGADLLEQLL